MGPSAPIRPMPTVASRIVGRACAISGNSSSMVMAQSSTIQAARNCMRSNSHPPTKLPITPPTPKPAKPSGIHAGDTRVTSSIVGAR